MPHYNKALQYARDGKLTHKSLDAGNNVYHIFCYSRDVFFSGEWDDITASHRGKIYRDDGTSINHVFPKIFNLNERPETQFGVVDYMLKNQPYCVMDKANGHLAILSHDATNDVWLLSTKGALDSEMIDDDKAVFQKQGYDTSNIPDGCTLLFEVIAAHDKHTLYNEQKAKYSPNGDDCFVLLGGYSCAGRPFNQGELYDMAKRVGCPLIEFYDQSTMPDDIRHCLEHKNIEGYVFWFYDSDFRVKVKTTEYWQHRFKKDLTPEKLVAKYANQSPHAMLRSLPEEVDAQVLDIIEKVAEEWYYDHIGMDNVTSKMMTMQGRDLFTHPHITQQQAQYIHAFHEGTWKGISASRDKRKAFYNWFINQEDEIKNMEEKLMDILN